MLVQCLRRSAPFVAVATLIVGAAATVLLAPAGCSSSVSDSDHHDTVDGGTADAYMCPDDPPDAPSPMCSSTFGATTWGGGGFCGLQTDSSCHVISPPTTNTACDSEGKEVGDKTDEFLNCECELNNKREEYAEKEQECTEETAECNKAETEAEAQCHCPKAQAACMAANYLYFTEIPQQELECRCDWDQLSNALCEFGNCMKKPECNCAAGLNKGGGAEGSSCSSGTQCQSGLCTVDSHTPYNADGSVNWTCAPEPPDYCCLTYADGACQGMSGVTLPSQCPPGSGSDGGTPYPAPPPRMSIPVGP